MTLKIIYAIGFLDLFCLSLLLPVTSIHVLSLGGTKFLLGLMGSLNCFLQLISGPVVGGWSDNRGRKPLLLASLLVNTIANLLLGINSLPIFIFSRLLFGVSWHSQILLKALITDCIPPEKQAKTFGQFGALAALAFIFGPIAGGILSSQENGFFYLSLISATASTTAFCLALFLPASTKKIEKSTNIGDEISKALTNIFSIDWNAYGEIFTMRFLTESSFAMFYPTLGLIMTEIFHATQLEVGYIISFHSILMILSNLSIDTIKAKLYNNDTTTTKIKMHGLIGLILFFTGLFLFPKFWVYLALFIPFSFVRKIVETTWQENLINITPKEEKGKVLGAFDSMVQMAGLITPLISGYVGDVFGYNAIIFLCIWPAVMGCVLVLSKRTKVD